MELKGCTLEELKVGSLTDCKVVRVMSGNISSRFPQGSVPGTTSFSIFITCPNNDVKSVPRWLGAGALTLKKRLGELDLFSLEKTRFQGK